MSGSEERQEGLHLYLQGYYHVFWCETLWMHRHHIWKEAEADVPRKSRNLPSSGLGCAQDGVAN